MSFGAAAAVGRCDYESERAGRIPGRVGVGMERHRRFASQSREEQYQMLYPPPVSRNPSGWPVEIWRPYADRRLHEFMLAIPPEQHFEPQQEHEHDGPEHPKPQRSGEEGLDDEAQKQKIGEW